MASKEKKIIKSETGITNRTFNYTLGGVNLSFTLRTDIKQDLKDFLALMEVASRDVQSEIDKK